MALRVQDLRRRTVTKLVGPSSFLATLSAQDRAALVTELVEDITEAISDSVVTSGMVPISGSRTWYVHDPAVDGPASIDAVQTAVNAAALWLDDNPAGHAIVDVRFQDEQDWVSDNPGVYGLRWPANCQGRLEVRGNGSRIKFTADHQALMTAHQHSFADPAQHTSYLTYGDLWLSGFRIDAEDSDGQSPVIFGTMVGGTTQRRQSFGEIRLWDIDADNVDPDRTIGVKHRPGVWIPLGALNSGDSTLRCEKVRINNVHVNGSPYGFWCGGVPPTNDSPVFEHSQNLIFGSVICEDSSHDRGVAPTVFSTSANFHVGSEAIIEKLRLRRFYGRFAGDVGIEHNNVVDGLVESCEVEDAWTIGVTHNQYTQMGLYRERQGTMHRDCHVRRRVLGVTGTIGKCVGFGSGTSGFNLSPATGDTLSSPLLYEDCTYEQINGDQEPGNFAYGMFRFSGPVPFISIKSCTCVERFTHTASTRTPRAMWVNTNAPYTRIEVDGFRTIVRGARVGSVTTTWGPIYINAHDVTLQQQSRVDLAIRNVEVDVDIDNPHAATVYGIELVGGRISGYIEKVRARRIPAAVTNPRLVRLTTGMHPLAGGQLVIDKYLVLRDIDLGQASAGSVAVDLASMADWDPNKKNVRLENVTPPAAALPAPVAVVPGASFKVVIAGATGGTLTYTLNGSTTTAGVAHNASAATLKAAFVTAGVDTNDMDVAGAGTAGNPYLITLKGSLAGQTGTLTTDPASLTAATATVTMTTETTGSATTNERIRLVLANATGGTYTLTVDSQTTAGIAPTDDNATIKSKIEALSSVAADDVTVYCDAPDAALRGSTNYPIVVTFAGSLARTDVAVSATGSSLTCTPSATVTSVRAGNVVEHLEGRPADYVVAGGTVSALEKSADRGANWTDLGITEGPVRLSQDELLRITNSGVPTVTRVAVR